MRMERMDRVEVVRARRPLGFATLCAATLLMMLATAESHGQQQPAPMQAQAPVQVQSPLPGAPGYGIMPAELFASNLGIYYRMESYGSSQGARLTRYPVAGSPASQIQLEPGDMIVSLDHQPIYGPNDLLNHTAQTSVQFVNIRTGQPQLNWVFIPTSIPNPGPFPNPNPYPPIDPGFGPLPFSLGVMTAMTTVPNTQPQPYIAPAPGQFPRLTMRPTYGLRISQVVYGSAAQRAGLEVGDVITSANGVPMSDANALRRVIASSNGALNLMIRDIRQPGVGDVPVYVPLDPTGGGVYASPVPAQAPTSATP